LGLVFAAVAVSAEQSGGDDASGGGEEHAPAPKKRSKRSKPAAVKPEASDAAVPLDALSKLPVEPLAMDAAALRDDDRQFDQFPKQLSGEENVEALTGSLKKAALLLQKMKRDVEGEKVWTKNVYDIIQNYQYKYLKTVQDVKTREEKIKKMERLVNALKQSTLHSAVEKELNNASKALAELVNRAGADAATGAVYSKVTARMAKLKHALKTMPRPRELYSDTTSKMQSILSSDLPPTTGDAVAQLNAGKKARKSTPKRKAAPKTAEEDE